MDLGLASLQNTATSDFLLDESKLSPTLCENLICSNTIWNSAFYIQWSETLLITK